MGAIALVNRYIGLTTCLERGIGKVRVRDVVAVRVLALAKQ